MTTLDPAAGYVVLINTFTVEPSRAEELLTALSRATATGLRQRPGFVSANLHVSHDKRHVANYAQWRSQEDLDSMMKDPAAQEHIRAAAEIATSFDPVYYELRETHSAETSPWTLRRPTPEHRSDGDPVPEPDGRVGSAAGSVPSEVAFPAGWLEGCRCTKPFPGVPRGCRESGSPPSVVAPVLLADGRRTK